MGDRGRKPASELSVMPTDTVEAVIRPDAPYDLTDEESEEWWAVVNAMPANWFPRETHASLANRCRHVVRARRIAQLLTKMESGKEGEEFDLDRYDKLTKMAERESRAINALERGLRMTLQSTYDKSKKKSNPVKRPWES